MSTGENTAPAEDSIPTTPSDSVVFDPPFRALRATTAGDIAITTLTGYTRVCAFVAGETRAIRGTQVRSTSTTATGIERMM